MPYCPHCGKPAGDQATKCVACGKSLETRAAPGRAFKGTLMIGAANAPDGHAAPAKPASQPEPAAPPPAAAPPLAAPPPAAAGHAPVAASSARKATMIGGMGMNPVHAGAAPKPAPEPIPEPAPPPAAESARQPAAEPDTSGATAPTPAAPPSGSSHREPKPEPQAKAAGLDAEPMPQSAPEPEPLVRGPQLSDSFDQIAPPTNRTWVWVLVGFGGMLLIAGCGVLAAKLMGLID